MANQAVQKGIKNSWSFMSFARQFDKVQLGSFKDKETGQEFKSLVMSNGDSKTFVNFSSNLGELSVSEIKAQKADLQVVELESGTYKLCRQGNGGWEDVDIF
jgi:hypothetical protein